MTTTTVPLAARTHQTRTVGLLLGIGGVLLGAGGQLHPIGDEDTLPAALASMTGDQLWTVAHLFMLAGLSVALVGLATAYRGRVLDPGLDLPLKVAIWGYSFGALELVPHLLASRDHDQLANGEITAFVRVHLVLQAITSPILAISTIILAIAIARSARTKPSWILAGLVTLGGTAFGLAGPLVSLTEEPVLAALFAGEFAVAVWLVGTGIRLARRPGGDREDSAPARA